MPGMHWRIEVDRRVAWHRAICVCINVFLGIGREHFSILVPNTERRPQTKWRTLTRENLFDFPSFEPDREYDISRCYALFRIQVLHVAVFIHSLSDCQSNTWIWQQGCDFWYSTCESAFFFALPNGRKKNLPREPSQSYPSYALCVFNFWWTRTVTTCFKVIPCIRQQNTLRLHQSSFKANTGYFIFVRASSSQHFDWHSIKNRRLNILFFNLSV